MGASIRLIRRFSGPHNSINQLFKKATCVDVHSLLFSDPSESLSNSLNICL